MNIRQKLSKITPSRKDEDENEGGGYTQSPETLVTAVSVE